MEIEEIYKTITKKAKEKGFEPKTLSTIWFNNACLGIKETGLINENVTCCYLAEVQKRLREVHKINIDLSYEQFGIKESLNSDYVFKIQFIINGFNQYIKCKKTYNTYEEALANGIIESLKLIK